MSGHVRAVHAAQGRGRVSSAVNPITDADLTGSALTGRARGQVSSATSSGPEGQMGHTENHLQVQRHPRADAIRCAADHSPPDPLIGESFALLRQSLELVLERCASSETCSQRHADLAVAFYSLVAGLKEEPLPIGARGTTYQVGADEFVELIVRGCTNQPGSQNSRT